MGLQQIDRAHEDLKKAAQLAPQDKGIRSELDAIREKLQVLAKQSAAELKANLSKANS